MNKVMRSLLLIILALLPVAILGASAEEPALLYQLDSLLCQRPAIIDEKQNKIDRLKRMSMADNSTDMRLQLFYDLYQEYYVFKFDSAMVYARKGLELARQAGSNYYTTLYTLKQTELLAIGGLYSEAANALSAIDTTKIDARLRFDLYATCFSLYAYWSDYCDDPLYAPVYRQKANNYLKRAMEYASNDSPTYLYFMGEYATFVSNDRHEARRCYEEALSRLPSSSRHYAMSCFALAGNYRNEGDEQAYEDYLTRAAMSDVESCTMENMALQTLAVQLFQKGAEHLERAERYINISMEDAQFYNNRLRILEIAKSLPTIVNTYQAHVQQQNHSLRRALIFISLLVMAMLGAVLFIFRQNKLLTRRRHELSAANTQLSALNGQLKDANGQLSMLNTRLSDTNSRREGLARIYIELCAKYIDKLGKYQTLVKRKIKANQVQELLSTISSTRISEEDAQTFLSRFDKAFLELYPTFVDEFNALLQREFHIQQKQPGVMTTELRTFALIRLGVKNTADIAGLLFLSPQTIYNCRSVVKAHALVKDNFDEQVSRLCAVV